MEILIGILIAIIVILAIMLVLFIIAGISNRKHDGMCQEGDIVWKARKRTFLGFPLSFTVYSLSEERLFVKTGLLTTVENEVRLYRVLDVQLKQTLGQKIQGLGTIFVRSSDKSLKSFYIMNIPNSRNVKEMISEYVEKQRKANRVSNRELMSDFDDDQDDGIDDGEVG